MAVEQGTSRIEARTSGDRGDEPWLPVVLAAAGSLAPDAAELWEKALEFWPPYADYQLKTDREIPVVVLDPVP